MSTQRQRSDLSYHDFDGVEVLLEPDYMQAIKPDMKHIISCRKFIGIEHTASNVFDVF